MNTNKRPDGDVRLRVEAALASQNRDAGGVPEKLWTYLDADGKVAQVVAGEKEIEWLVGEVRKLMALGQPDSVQRSRISLRSPARSTEGLDERGRAVSLILASEASKDRAVVEFRARVLKGRLLPSTKAAQTWISETFVREGPSTVWLTDVPVPEGYALQRDAATGHVITDPVLKLEGAIGARGIRYRVLALDLSASEAVFTSATGTLEQLRQVSEDLATRFRWDIDDAAVFVLTGRAPSVEPITVTWHMSKAFPVCSRVILEVDPTLRPSDVARAYHTVRRSMWPRRSRALGKKHASLAAFIEERSTGTTWRQRFAEWNRKNPTALYSSESNFRRDALKARRRLLTPSIWAEGVDLKGEASLEDLEQADDLILPDARKRQRVSPPASRRRRKRR